VAFTGGRRRNKTCWWLTQTDINKLDSKDSTISQALWKLSGRKLYRWDLRMTDWRRSFSAMLRNPHQAEAAYRIWAINVARVTSYRDCPVRPWARIVFTPYMILAALSIIWAMWESNRSLELNVTPRTVRDSTLVRHVAVDTGPLCKLRIISLLLDWFNFKLCRLAQSEICCSSRGTVCKWVSGTIR